MGYTTEFSGSFRLDRPLAAEHAAYLHKFNQTRRMKRDSVIAAHLADPVRIAAGLPVGVDGCYFVGGLGFAGQSDDASVLDHNHPPEGQPGLWCQWMPSDEATAIVWDRGEKFYSYVEWIIYLIDNFLAPWGYRLNGTVRWKGEDSDDRGRIVIKNNIVSTPSRAASVA